MNVMLRDASPKGPRIAQVALRLVPDAQAEPFLRDALRIAGVKKVEQTFPGDHDTYLASLYVADIDATHLAQALEELENDARVESVEKPAPRKLIRPHKPAS